MKFILTKELGRLAKWLRILGYDSSFYSGEKISTLVITALRQQRVILTRNSRIGRFPGPRLVKIESDFVEQQIKQLLNQLQLQPQSEQLFSRCVICNVKLAKADELFVKSQVPNYVLKTQNNFMHCPQCKRVYWPGTHWTKVRSFLGEILMKN